MKLYCCACVQEVEARLTDGREIYPHRPDLHHQPFWKCDGCGNKVGCHWKTGYPTKPLGNIPTPEITKARQHIHRILDPLWKSGRIKRGRLYKMISKELGYEYHTAEIKTLDEARIIYGIIGKLVIPKAGTES